MKKLGVIVLLTFLILACDATKDMVDQKEMEENSLMNTSWVIEYYTKDGITTNVYGFQFPITFQTNEITSSICNNYSASYAIQQDSLIDFTMGYVTEIYCNDSKVWNTETFIQNHLQSVATFQKSEEGLVLKIDENNEIGLTEVDYVEEEQDEQKEALRVSQQTLFVNHTNSDCVGIASQKCLLVKDSEEKEWENFYDTIQGFTWEEGYTYQLKVEVEYNDNLPADASSLKYSLLEVVSKKKA